MGGCLYEDRLERRTVKQYDASNVAQFFLGIMGPTHFPEFENFLKEHFGWTEYAAFNAAYRRTYGSNEEYVEACKTFSRANLNDETVLLAIQKLSSHLSPLMETKR